MHQKKYFLSYFAQSAKSSVFFFFFFFLHLISLPVLPNGPIRKVCAIISRVHCKEKTNCFSVPRGWITFWNIM